MSGPGSRVVMASRNRHKVQGDSRADRRPGLELVSIDDPGPDHPLLEDENTFEGNALAKARQAAPATGLPRWPTTRALEVDALGGAPGVCSARYAGEPSGRPPTTRQLLSALSGVPPEPPDRALPLRRRLLGSGQRTHLTAAGSCEGWCWKPARSGRLRLRPAVPGSRPWARPWPRSTWLEKNRLSHRAAAFRSLAGVAAGVSTDHLCPQSSRPVAPPGTRFRNPPLARGRFAL
jgi:XTP/dITP diphosphohydrolase